MKSYAIMLLIIVALVLAFRVSWFNLATAEPLAQSLLRGEFRFEPLLVVGSLILTFLFVLLNKPSLILLAALGAFSYFLYLPLNAIKAGYELVQQENFLAGNDPFFMLRFLSNWFWIHAAIVLIMLLIAISNWRNSKLDDEDDDESET